MAVGDRFDADVVVVGAGLGELEAARVAARAELAEAMGRPMTHVLDEAANALERRIFSDRLAARFAELRRGADAWGEIGAERAEESSSLSDRSG